MVEKRKNVIFLVVDSLRYDRLGFSGYEPSPSPFLDQLAKRSVVFNHCYVTGCPTDFAYPGLVASTLPLDDGGYFNGLSDRKKTLGEVFRDARYHTSLFLPYAWPSTHGQTRGYKDVFHVYSLYGFHPDLISSIAFTKELILKDPSHESEYINYFSEYLSGFFKDLTEYLESSGNGISVHYFSLLNMPYDLQKTRDIIFRERACYSRDPIQYSKTIIFQKVLPPGPKSLADALVPEKIHPNPVQKHYRLLKYTAYLFNKFNSYRKFADKHQLKRFEPDYSPRNASGKIFIDFICDWLDLRTDNEPFFIWAHLTDPHDVNFSSYEFPVEDDEIKTEFHVIKTHFNTILRRIWRRRGNPLYDLSVRYIDHQIERLQTFLEKKKLWDDTILVICADHGCLYSAWPLRPANAHCTTHFYDELYHIPVIIAGGGIRGRSMDQLLSTMDIAPSVLDLVQVTIPDSYKGHSAVCPTISDSRQYVISEHMGPGFCNWRVKPVYICVRNEDWKLVYKAPTVAQTEKAFIDTLFNLKEDPLELKDLASVLPHPDQIVPLLTIAKDRLHTLSQEHNEE